jgi:DeoR/GlpR family transcriptional regulator of sugar metabolism
MNKLFKQKVVLFVGISLMIIGVSGIALEDAVTSVAPEQVRQEIIEEVYATSISSNANGTVVQHDGISGQNALSVLRSGAEVMVDQVAVDKTIIAINGVTNEESLSWFLYVNGKSLNTSAIAYVTNDTDRLEWRLEEGS